MEDFWLYNYSILFEEWYVIFPHKNMSRNEFLNSLSRFSFLAIFLFTIIKSNFTWFLIPLAILVYSLFLGIDNNQDEIDNYKKLSEKKCRKPTNNNPYMNILRNEEDINMPACEFNKKDVDKKYKFNLYQNSNDLFDVKHLERQFYTMPVTTIPNDIVTFGKWLYGTEGNCKYDGTRCLVYEDERYH